VKAYDVEASRQAKLMDIYDLEMVWNILPSLYRLCQLGTLEARCHFAEAFAWERHM